ncbi:unnamed protein product [Camellia sinensis]
MRKFEGQRDMLYNQTFNLDQVEFASEGIKDAKQTVSPQGEMDALEALFSESNAMSALKSANKKLKKMTKTLKIQDISLLVEAMMYLITVIDEEELMGVTSMLWKLTWAWRQKVMGCLHIFILIWKEELILPPAPTGHAAPAVPASRVNQDTMIELCRSSTTTTSLANLAMLNFLTERTVEDEFGLPVVAPAGLDFSSVRDQGGIDENEDPRDVAIGELREETGITSAEVLAEVPYWLTNDFPPKVREKLKRQWGSNWKGQAQKW